MKRRLTERDLNRIVRRIINEDRSNSTKNELLRDLKSFLDSATNSPWDVDYICEEISKICEIHKKNQSSDPNPFNI